VQVDQQVAVQDQHVPGQHRHRPVEAADAGQDVPQPIGPAHVDDDEADAHRDGRDGQELADDHDVVHVVVVVEVGRDDHHHRAGGQADAEGEVGDVEAPRDVVGHAVT
jgi:hypothetical protein